MTDEDSRQNPKPEVTEERVDGLLQRVSARRREMIRKSVERPLKIEILRTCYMVGCVLLDLAFVPIAMMELFGRPGIYLSILPIIPLVYLEYRVHEAWFVKDWAAARERENSV